MKTVRISAFVFIFPILIFVLEATFFAQDWHIENNISVNNEIPEGLRGIWQGSDRIVLFSSKNTDGKTDASIILKTLYEWYYDRCAEPENFSEYPRDLNSVTGQKSVKLTVDFTNLTSGAVGIGEILDGAWEMALKFEDKSTSIIPVARIGNNIYLDFLVKLRAESAVSAVVESADPVGVDSANSVTAEIANPLYGAWLGVGVASGITACAPVIQKELISYYITENSVYYIRYWQTDMEYSPLMATFSDGEQDFYIPKHIKSAGKLYTCVTGRSLQIRNVTRSPLVAEDFTLDSSGQVLVHSKAYLSLFEKSVPNGNLNGNDDKLIDQYIQLVKDANSRRKPEPAPLFPVSDLNWHWKEINEIEKDNQQIQAVRERQKQFAQKQYERKQYARQSQALNQFATHAQTEK